MKLESFQTLDITALIGALVTNTNGAEFYIVGVGVDLAEHRIMLELAPPEVTDSTVGVYWDDVEDWSIQLRARTIKL